MTNGETLTKPDKKKRRRWPWVIVGLVVAFFVFAGIMGQIDPPKKTAASPKVTSISGSPEATTTPPTRTTTTEPPSNASTQATAAASPTRTMQTSATPTAVAAPAPASLPVTQCGLFNYGRAASGAGTSVFLDDIDAGPYKIVIHRSGRGDYTTFLSPRFPGASVVEGDYPDIDYGTVTGVDVSDNGEAPCSITTHD